MMNPVSEQPTTSSITPFNSKEAHQCSECDFSTSKRLQLKKHLILNHADTISQDLLLNQHKCEFCEKVFKDPVQLSNHKNVHLGLKPYKCVQCEQYFTTRGELIRHTRYKWELGSYYFHFILILLSFYFTRLFEAHTREAS